MGTLAEVVGIPCGSSGPQTYQRLGVAENVVLKELVQHVEEVVMHQGLNHQLIQIVLEDHTDSCISANKSAWTNTVYTDTALKSLK